MLQCILYKLLFEIYFPFSNIPLIKLLYFLFHTNYSILQIYKLILNNTKNKHYKEVFDFYKPLIYLYKKNRVGGERSLY